MSAIRPQVKVGYTVGELTVVRSTEERKAGYIVWACRCSCGNEIRLDTRYLQRGTVTDCGCITKVKPRQLDVTGQRFGRLVCISPIQERSSYGKTIWFCRCDCGNECEASLKQLTSGYKKSCGCLGHPALKDYVGKKFGQLTVVEYAGKRSGMHRWRCMCECGRETVVGQTLLQTGKTKSCGCLKAEAYVDNLKLCEGTSVTLLEAGKRRLRSTNTSGYTGVCQSKKTGRWVARITFKGKTYHLGSYEDIQDVVTARHRGEEMHDEFLEWYYENHPKLMDDSKSENP